MNLYVLIGIPGSGKSTYAQEHLSHTAVCSSDKYVEEFAQDSGKTYSEVFPDAIKMANSLFNVDVGMAAREKLPITIDRTNLSAGSRRRWMEWKGEGYKIHAIAFLPPLRGSVGWVELQRRLASRPGKEIPQNVIDRMCSQFEVPTFEEGFDSITFINSLSLKGALCEG